MEYRKVDKYIKVKKGEGEGEEFYYPEVVVEEIDEDVNPGPARPANKSRNSGGARRSIGRKSDSKPVRMYELDPTVYPEAAAARASYENRIKKNQEKDKLMTEIVTLKQRNKMLELENKLLKEQLSNVDTQISYYDWLAFFREAGIKPVADVQYSIIFERNRIKPTMLIRLTERILREMQITAFKDIVAIIKHAHEVGENLQEEDPLGEQQQPARVRVGATESCSKQFKKAKLAQPDEYDEEGPEPEDGIRIVHVQSLSEVAKNKR